MPSDRGHRALPHTADVILEAWAPDLAACLEEAVDALVDTYAEADEGARRDPYDVRLPPGPPERVLVDLLDEVVYALDTADGVPVGASVRSLDEAGLHAVLWLAPPDQVSPTGSVPKAVSHSELAVDEAPGAVSCRFLVDV
ncbi:MAG: archease [Acidimicrobiia bacterium]